MNTIMTLLATPALIVTMVINRWYGDGWRWWRAALTGSFGSIASSIALGEWVRSWTLPMYAQWDWQGRIISWFFRTGIIMLKSVEALIVRLLWTILLGAYLLIPLATFFFILHPMIN